MTGLVVGVDVGGTFTDFVLARQDPPAVFLWKRPSNPARPDVAIVEGLAEALAQHRLAAADITRFAHGTTVGTNALIEGRHGTVAVVTTDGFRDLLEIARQTRPRIYDIHLDHPAPLVPRRLRHEVPERRLADGAVDRPLDVDAVRRVAAALAGEKVDCVVVCFLHADRFPEHEQRAVEILRAALGAGVDVICSSAVYPEFREFERFSTAVLNGALRTVLRAYLTRLGAGIAGLGVAVPALVSQSAGGLLSLADARDLPARTALSGPAAGVIGAAHRAALAGFPDIITIDVGGTSTDTSLVAGGRPARLPARQLAGYTLRLPTMDVTAVGAGGGSIAWLDRDGLLKVGPHSAGADPGPVCYARGGRDVTVTDAQVVLGRLPRDALLDGRMPIDSRRAEDAVAALAGRLGLSPIDTALGVVRVASANMVRAIRTISVERGHRPADFALFAFGGAGPMHATDVARDLDMTSIIVPPQPGLLCAEGLLFCDLVNDVVASLLATLDEAAVPELAAARASLHARAARWFEAERIAPADRRIRWTAELRYAGQNFELAVPLPDRAFDTGLVHAMRKDFEAAHERAYGYAFAGERIEAVTLKLTAIGVLSRPPVVELAPRAPAAPTGRRPVWFDATAAADTPVYRREQLARDQAIAGPAIIDQLDTTVPIFPGQAGRVDPWGNLVIAAGG